MNVDKVTDIVSVTVRLNATEAHYLVQLLQQAERGDDYVIRSHRHGEIWDFARKLVQELQRP